MPIDPISKERPTLLRIHQCQIRIHNPFPPAGDVVVARREQCVPLLLDKGAGAEEGRGRGDGEHVRGVDEGRGVAEEGGVVDFVLEEDAGEVVGGVARGLDGGGGEEVDVGVEGAGLEGEHEVAREVSVVVRMDGWIGGWGEGRGWAG